MQIFFSFFLPLFISFSTLSGEESSAAQNPSKNYRLISEIENSGKLRIGMYHDDPYFSYKDSSSNHLEGFDADIARAIAEEIMGDAEKIEYIPINSEKRIESLKKADADIVIAELAMTDQRKAIVDFSDVYYIAGQSILVNVNSPFQSLKDLSGQTIGAIIGTVNLTNIQSELPNSRIMVFPSLAAGFKALNERRIQAFCIDDVMLIALKVHPERMLLDYRFIGKEISFENYGIAVAKGNSSLLKAINKALDKIKSDGRWQEIYDRNIGKISRISIQPHP